MARKTTLRRGRSWQDLVALDVDVVQDREVGDGEADAEAGEHPAAQPAARGRCARPAQASPAEQPHARDRTRASRLPDATRAHFTPAAAAVGILLRPPGPVTPRIDALRRRRSPGRTGTWRRLRATVQRSMFALLVPALTHRARCRARRAPRRPPASLRRAVPGVARRRRPLDGRLLLLLSTDPSAEPRFQVSDTNVGEEPAGLRHRRRRLEAGRGGGLRRERPRLPGGEPRPT